MSNIDSALDELAAAKRAFESRLQSLISEEIHAFRRATGVSVRDMHIDFVDITNINDKRRQYAAGTVKALIAID
jgi:hypothetical protein